jgi:ADP-ribose pyrophosphatase YjhB (NUDIX family)
VSAARRTRLAAYALCVDDGRLLLCRIAPGYPAAGAWTLPGGGVDFGEDPADAVLRELTEETGLAGRIERLAFVNSIAGPESPEVGRDAWHGVRIVYRVTITGGSLRDEVDESTDRADWIPLTDVRQLSITELVHVALDHIEGGAGSSDT